MTNLDKIRQLYNLVENKKSFGYEEHVILELEARLKISLPEKIRNYYLTLGENENINYSRNRLLKPEDGIGFSDDNYLLFYEENQDVVYWGIKEKDLKLDNPPVLENYGTNEKPDWHVEANTIKDFFLLMAVYNGTIGGLRYNANSVDTVESETTKKIENNWQEIPEISWDKQKVFTDNFNEIIRLSFDEKGICTAIFIGTSYKK